MNETPGKYWVGPRDVGRALAVLPGIGEDPNRTDLVGVFIAELTGPSFSQLFRAVWSDPIARGMLQTRRDLRATLADRARLRALPEGTLGRAYFEWTEARHFDADGLAKIISEQVPRNLDTAEAALAARVVDMHDLWHIVNGWDDDIFGELHILGYSYAQLGSQGWLLLALLSAGGLVLLGRTEGYAYLADGLRRGRRSSLLAAADWEALLELPLDEVRRRLHVDPPREYRRFPMDEFLRLRGKSRSWRALNRTLRMTLGRGDKPPPAGRPEAAR